MVRELPNISAFSKLNCTKQLGWVSKGCVRFSQDIHLYDYTFLMYGSGGEWVGLKNHMFCTVIIGKCRNIWKLPNVSKKSKNRIQFFSLYLLHPVVAGPFVWIISELDIVLISLFLFNLSLFSLQVVNDS